MELFHTENNQTGMNSPSETPAPAEQVAPVNKQREMDVYHVMIELKDPDNALGFTKVAEEWFDYLTDRDLILGWRLLRRKFGLASGEHTDFIAELEVENMAALQETFARINTVDDEQERLYRATNNMIKSKRVGLYRTYPDVIRRERIALI